MTAGEKFRCQKDFLILNHLLQTVKVAREKIKYLIKIHIGVAIL